MRQLPALRRPPIDLDDDRTLCLDCRGKGCAACAHSGQVCPVCRGLRVVRRSEWSEREPWADTVARCDACCVACTEGNQVNPEKEASVIVAYHRARERQAQQHITSTDAL